MLGFGFLGLSSVANGHSWIHCTDYRGDVGTYESAQCFGHPRPKNGNYPDAQAFGVDRGHDTQNAVCQSTDTNNAQFPTATYKRGQVVTLAWPSKNHVAAECTNPFIPDTSTKLFFTTGTPGANPNPANLQQMPASFSDDPHVNGVIDFKGFQNCPNFCDNTDKSLCTGTFTVPANMAEGTYTFQWSWVFNNGAPPYVSCFEATVSGTETAPAPVTAPTNPPVNTGPAPTPRPTTATEASCGGEGVQCDGAMFGGSSCCQNGLTCFRQSAWYSSCLPSCPSDWECSETATCAAKGEQCGGLHHDGTTCCSSGTCYKNSGYYSQCRDNCPSTWECSGSMDSDAFGMGGGGVSLGVGALIAFLLLATAALGVLYGRCWERKSAAKAEAGEAPNSDLDKMGESLNNLQLTQVKKPRRSTLTMPKVDKKAKPTGAPPRPPARKAPPAAPATRPPTFRKNDYVTEV